MQKLYFFLGKLKSSFWFVPILIILIAIGAALGLIYLDSVVNLEPSGVLQFIFTSSTSSARSVLSIISAAMIGVAGTVFSITLVALTLASSQFGPRLLRNFMLERINQVVLGTYVSTYVYCLIVLNSIKEYDQISFVPSFSVFFAILATVANIILLIVFIHHIAISIQADKVISDIYESLSKNIVVLFPEKIGEEHKPEKAPDLELLKKHFPKSHQLKAIESGYLQYIDNDSVLNIAVENNFIIEINFRPGDYFIKDMNIGMVHGAEEVEEDIIGRLQKVFIVGKVRTPQQDAEFSVHQIVEIAGRALSPGINDPYTAVACIDNLTSILCQLTTVKFPSKYRYDKEDRLRVVAESVTFEGILNTAFNQIRQFASGTPSIVIRLMEALVILMEFANNDVQRESILRHARMVQRVAENSFEEENDLDDLRRRSKLLL